jgi:Hsp90 protein
VSSWLYRSSPRPTSSCGATLSSGASLRRALAHARYIWESGADGAFAISEDTEGAPLGRGTQINIYLKVIRLRQCSAALPTAGISHGVHATVQGKILWHAPAAALKPCMHACMQEEAQEYVQEQKLRDLVSQYSEFINFPIYMYTSKQVSTRCRPCSVLSIAPRHTKGQPLHTAQWALR